MDVTIVDGDLPYPATSGKRLRTLHLMLRLARRHRITYITRGSGRRAEAETAQAYLAGHGIESVIVEDPLPRKAGPLFYGRLAANLLSPLPYSVATHLSRRVEEALANHCARRRVDLWQLEWTAFARAVRGTATAAPQVVMAPNVDSLIWQRYYENERSPLKRWYIGQQWRKFERFERRVFHEATRVVTVSAEDAALVRDRFGMPRVDVVDNGIDRDYFAALDSQRRDAHRLLFLGSLDWRPNLDALALLLDHIFPAVRAAEPAAQLTIVGRCPSPALRERVRRLDGVELHADVADVRPYLTESGVLAVPLRIGGGSRLKILEALAAGLPVVSTRVGAEGLELRPGRDLVVADSPEDMARALVQTIRSPGSARALAEEGRRFVLQRYDWDALAQRLEQIWEECLVVGQDANPVGV